MVVGWIAWAVSAASSCEDAGPWPCAEEGCPTPTISCSSLSKTCEHRFSDVWKSPPEGFADRFIYDSCPVTCGRCPPSSGGRAEDVRADDVCVSWRQTSDCSASGKRQPQKDVGCNVRVRNGWSGYCECRGGVRAGDSNCQHDEFTCQDMCVKQWAWLREQRQQRQSSSEKEEAFDADGNLIKLYKRGKGFYVMGNTELALRHFREALKLDPEHQECKADYKQAKKLQKLLDKIEGVMGKEVEGKGRQKQLEREDQYEEARTLLTQALELLPPSVYRASLYRDLCICNTKMRRPEDALKVCQKHSEHDSESAASNLLLAEAKLLNEHFEDAIALYRKVLEQDENSKEARSGLQQALPTPWRRTCAAREL